MQTTHPTPSVAVIGGGVAGSTIALRLGLAGVPTVLLERRASLVDGPPMCHLHAGGALYREISDDDCRILLRQSLDVAALYPESMDARPTVIAVPTRDPGDPADLLPRAQMLAQHYATLVADGRPALFGDPADFSRSFDRAELERLAALTPVVVPKTVEDWVAAAARVLDLDTLKFPVLAVQEYGWNIFRLAAGATLRLADVPSVDVRTSTTVVGVERTGDGWVVTTRPTDAPDGAEEQLEVDVVVNAAGFRVGEVDDLAHAPAEHAVEFKGAYLAYWASAADTALPEIVVHGERDTERGMAQVTPYSGGYVQLHGMVPGITIFHDGKVSSEGDCCQPALNPTYVGWVDGGWDTEVVVERTRRAIDHATPFLPTFASAEPTGLVLGGAQQVPGGDVSARVGRLRVDEDGRYLVAEVAKACAAVDVADDVVSQLVESGLLPADVEERPDWPVADERLLPRVARVLAQHRGFPAVMADVRTPLV